MIDSFHLLKIGFVGTFFILLVANFKGAVAEHSLTVKKIDSRLTFSADEDNPNFAHFELGAQGTQDKYDAFQQRFADIQGQDVDISIADIDHPIYQDTTSLSAKPHSVHNDIMGQFDVLFKDNKLIYILYTFDYQTIRLCETSFKQLSNNFTTRYGALTAWDELTHIKLDANYDKTYHESPIIDDTFAISIQHNCYSVNDRSVTVQLSYLPEIFNEQKIQAVIEYNNGLSL